MINTSTQNPVKSFKTMGQQEETQVVVLEEEEVVELQKLEKNHLSESRKQIKWWILLASCVATTVGSVGVPLTMRLYYKHSGSRKWLPTLLLSVAFPLFFIPLIISHFRNRSNGRPKMAIIKPKLMTFAVVIGLIFGADNFMYSAGVSYLPVSTSTILFSTQLAFTAIFSFLIVKQKFTPYSVNAVLLMILGAILLGVAKGGDRPPNVNDTQYIVGFILTLGGAALLGFYIPSVELAYLKGGQEINFSIVAQFQIVINFSATVLSIIGMLINHDFQALPGEAVEFGLGEVKYYIVLVTCAILSQVLAFGSLGVIFCSSSLLCGILTTATMPITEVFGALLFKEKFTGEKGLSLVLCLWGVTSYFYGVYRKSKKDNMKNKTDSSDSTPSSDLVNVEIVCPSPSKNTIELTPVLNH